jgi:hypothetical protein
MLGACSLIPPPPHPQRTAHIRSRPRPVASTAPSGSAAAAAALRPTPAPAPPVKVVGLSEAEVRHLLGPPAATATQGPAQTWTYRSAGCRVDIAFYYDVSRSNFFALSQQRQGGGDGADCLGQIHGAGRD